MLMRIQPVTRTKTTMTNHQTGVMKRSQISRAWSPAGSDVEAILPPMTPQPLATTVVSINRSITSIDRVPGPTTLDFTRSAPSPQHLAPMRRLVRRLSTTILPWIVIAVTIRVRHKPYVVLQRVCDVEPSVASARFEERRARQSAAFGSANQEAQLRDLREARSSLAETTCAQTAHSSFMESMERRMKGSCLRAVIPNIRLRSRSILRTRSRRLESRCFGAGLDRTTR